MRTLDSLRSSKDKKLPGKLIRKENIKYEYLIFIFFCVFFVCKVHLRDFDDSEDETEESESDYVANKKSTRLDTDFDFYK